MSIFEKGNLVKIRYPNQQGSYDSERALEESFSYTSILTKKSLAEKTAALIYVHLLSLYGGHMLSIHLTSKNLVSRVVDTGGRVYTYAG